MKHKYILLLIVAFFVTLNIQSQTTSAEVGTLPGNFAVSPTGAATYSIPLSVPEGRAGMTPSVSLNYNSQAGNGVMGIGWNMGGLSTITRTGTTIYHDGVVSGVDFSDDDKIMLDGQRLIVVNTTATETEYRTETETYSKIVGYGTAGYGHQYYKVWTKGGQIIEYGKTEDSRIQALNSNGTPRYSINYWHINSIEDRQGNNIEFSYLEINGVGFIDKISYGANKNTSEYPPFRLQFQYSNTRSDDIIKYIDGGKMIIEKLLDKIIIYNGATKLKTYAIDYNESLSSHVNHIKLYAGDESDPYLNETVFEWGVENHASTTETHYFTQNNVDSYFVDYNGDGIKDLIRASYNHENHAHLFVDMVLISNGSGFDEYNTSIIGQINSDMTPTLQIGDFDGNGIDELILSYKNILMPENNTYIWKFIDIYPYFVKVVDLAIPFGKQSGAQQLIPGDFTGDGRTDLLVVGEFTIGATSNYEDRSYLYEVKFSDDGYPTGGINGIGNTWYTFPTVDHRIYTGDFNGDGITDLLANKADDPGTSWEIYCFNGKDSWKTFEAPPLINFDPKDDIDQHIYGIKVSDYNGDGLSDIAEFEKESNSQSVITASYKIYYSNGNSLNNSSPATGIINCYGGLNFMGGNHPIPHFNHKDNLDFNGDGRSDMHQTNGFYNDNIYIFDSDNTSNQLLSITNGLGNRTEISYKPLTNEDVYTKGGNSQFPVIDLMAPLYVVEKVTPDEVLGTKTQQIYEYEGARLHKQGKGFLGFSKVVYYNIGSNTKTTTSYSLFTETIGSNELYFIPFPETITKHSLFDGSTDQNKKLSETTIEMDVIRTQTTTDLVHFPVTTSSITYTWDNDADNTFVSTSKTVQPIEEIDSYGNSLKLFKGVDGRELSSGVDVYDYNYYSSNWTNYAIDVDNWLISRPSYLQTSKLDRVGDQYVYKTSKTIDYYTDPLATGFSLPRSILEKSIPYNTADEEYYNSFDTKIEYTYDIHGNVIKEILSAPNSTDDLENVVTEYKYDYSDDYHSGYAGRYLTRIITSSPGENYVQQTVYDPVTGNVEKEISPSGLITSYEYDSFGKWKKTLYPDGTYDEVKFKWCDNPTARELYYSMSNDQRERITVTYYDKFNRETKKVYPHYWMNMSYFKYYDSRGRLDKVSRPIMDGRPVTHWTTYSYDDLGRTQLILEYTGNLTSYEYIGLKTIRTDNYTGVCETTIVDVLGRTLEVIDPTGSVKYKYHSNGKPKKVIANGIVTEMDYDPVGNQKILTDANAGTSTYTYDAYGRLIEQKDGKGNHYVMNYDIMNRLVYRNLKTGGESTTYEYNDKLSVNGLGKLITTTYDNVTYTYTYDQYSRLLSKTESFQLQNYTKSYTYDIHGNISTYTYPSGFQISYDYETDGSLVGVKDAVTQGLLWGTGAIHYEGQLAAFVYGNGLKSYKDYDEYGFIHSIQTGIDYQSGEIQDMEYNFNRYTGNLTNRKQTRDNVILTESFTYDEILHSRLKTWQVAGLQQYQANYNNLGNITGKSDVVDLTFDGEFTYGLEGPHAVTGLVQPTQTYQSQATDQTIEYTPFNKTHRIDQAKDGSVYTYSIDYGPDQTRKMSILFKNYVVDSYTLCR